MSALFVIVFTTCQPLRVLSLPPCANVDVEEVVVCGGVVRGVCGVWRGVWCWSWVCLEERYPLDGLKPKKCLPLFMRIAMVESRTCIFFWCYVGVTP
jgi:hypothetical protein